MWSQPWFFSIGRRHLGQSFVCVSTQFAVSESDEFFASHARTVSHDTGRCASSPQLQQKPCQQSQNMSRAPASSTARAGAAGGGAPLDAAAVLLHVRQEREPGVPVLVRGVGRRVDEVLDDGRRAGRVRAPRAVAHSGVDVPAPAAQHSPQ